jgi:hypothetical protein
MGVKEWEMGRNILSTVIAGPDLLAGPKPLQRGEGPAIHLLAKRDGYAGQARV